MSFYFHSFMLYSCRVHKIIAYLLSVLFSSTELINQNLSFLLASAMGRLETCTLLFIISILYYPNETSTQPTTEPVNVGFIVALPWDISNTLRAPFGGPISIALSVIMAGILLFGLLLAPVNYILGYPSRIYHPSRNPGLIETMIYQKKKEKLGGLVSYLMSGIKGRSLDETELFAVNSTEIKEFDFVDGGRSMSSMNYPDFVTSAFYFVPEEDEGCRKLILCHTHGILKIFPSRLKQIIRFFSKRSMSIPDEYKSAVLLGLRSHSECQGAYKCSKDMTSLMKEILYALVSSDLKSMWNLQKLF